MLRQWVTEKGNVDAIEARLEIQRVDSLRGERVWEQVAIKDMSKRPYNFSRHLDCYLLSSPNPAVIALHSCCPCEVGCHLRRKVEAIISRGDGEEDPDCPGVLEETKFWVVVKRSKTETTEQS